MRYMLRKEEATNLANDRFGMLTGHYRSDANAKRYLLERLARTDDARFPPGNYVIQTWPEHGTNTRLPERIVCAAYKTV